MPLNLVFSFFIPFLILGILGGFYAALIGGAVGVVIYLYWDKIENAAHMAIDKWRNPTSL